MPNRQLPPIHTATTTAEEIALNLVGIGANASEQSQWQALRQSTALTYNLCSNFAESRYIGEHYPQAETLAKLGVHLLNYFALANFINDTSGETVTKDQVISATSQATIRNMADKAEYKSVFSELAQTLADLTKGLPSDWREQAQAEFKAVTQSGQSRHCTTHSEGENND